MTDLRAIVYTSKATRHMAAQDIERLLFEARIFNQSHDVSGVLLYHAGSFFQFIEGPADGVAAVYARIREAKMHNSIVELLNAPASQRQFASWHMAFCEPPESGLEELETASWEDAIPMTRTIYERSQGLALLLYYWSKWKAEPYPNNSVRKPPSTPGTSAPAFRS